MQRESTKLYVVQEQQSSSKILLGHEDVELIFGRRVPFRPVFNPKIFTQLKQEREYLDKDYFILLDLINQGKNFSVRPKFIQFKGVLERYLSRNCVELYCYLRHGYKHHAELDRRLVKYEQSQYFAVKTIAKFLKKYSSPSTIYGDQFAKELKTIWVLLKLRFKEEHAVLYPLYKPH